MEGIDKIYVINLKRHPDRMEQFKKQLGAAGIPFDMVQRIEGVDGANLEKTPTLNRLIRVNDYQGSVGIIGCAMSHFRLWRRISGLNYVKRCIVFEDDVVLADDFVERWNEIISKIPDDCGFLYLNGPNDVDSWPGSKNETESVNKPMVPCKPVNEIFTKSYNHAYCLYSYMITPFIAKRLMQEVEREGIYCAIDGVVQGAFRGKKFVKYGEDHQIDGVGGYRLIKPITNTQFTYSDTISQKKMLFDLPLKKVLKVAWINWWPRFNSYCNPFRSFLENHFNCRILNVPPNEADLLMCSVFGNFHKVGMLFEGVKKVLFTGEWKEVHGLGYDLAIGFHHLEMENYIRIPLWFFFIDWYQTDIPYVMRDPDLIPLSWFDREGTPYKRDKFCLFVCTNGDCVERNELFDLINTIEQVDSAGKWKRNCKMEEDKTTIEYRKYTNRVEFERGYRFGLAAENIGAEGYCTEKVFLTFAAGAVPIYWGDPTMVEDFNEDAFIDANRLKGEELVARVKQVNDDPELWKKMTSTYPFKEGVLDKYWELLRSGFESLVLFSSKSG